MLIMLRSSVWILLFVALTQNAIHFACNAFTSPRVVVVNMGRAVFLATTDDADAEPFFEMQQIPTATTGARLGHVVDCAEHGECNVEEMTAMIEELERLNAECEGTLSRECNLDAVAARNVLKVALASKVIVEEAVVATREQEEEECSYDPYAAMGEMDDECLNNAIHGIPTAAMEESSLDRIVQCAEDGDCPVGEIAELIDELERLNFDCEGTISRECNLDAVEARNILKVALGSQAAMAREVRVRKHLP